MCLCSSLTYIINDIKDKEIDKIHSEKLKSRPLANGDLPVFVAYILFGIIASIEIYFIIYFHNLFSLMLGMLFLNGIIYNFILKKVAFADIITLSTT